MSPDPTHTGRAERVGLVLAIVIPAALVALWASPRPARPSEMPPLALPASDVRRSIAHEDAVADQAPDDALEERRRTLYLTHGLHEVRADESPEAAARRRVEMGRVVAEIVAAGGDERIAATRARDVRRMLAALRSTGADDLDEDERAGEVGLFPMMLTRYGAVVDGRRIAPEIVLRTLFAARWNAIHGREMTDGMDDLRLRAYHGWLALEGGAAPLPMRLAALDRYAAVRGPRMLEARGALQYEAGRFVEARRDFERAYELTGSLRLRNHALAAEMALQSGDADE